MTSPTPEVERAEVAALTSLYDAERGDQQVHLNVSLALIAGAVAYLGVMAAQFHELKRSYVWSVLIPFPLWMVAAFHVLLMATIVTRNRSIRILEARLYAATRLWAAGVTFEEIGRERARKVTDFRIQPWPLKIQSLVTYGGIVATLLSVTAYCLWHAHHIRGWTVPVIVSVPVYLAFTVLLAVAWCTATSWKR
ncbi:hypothetical protein NDR87_02770 [Nocardia sp. CDC159]|uniref:Uncharacterized protein n=1 Tax=Nocardia pulmonis TaxID=2951408 RepID=A0A9X2E0U7_9NOCA|nr:MULTISPECIES: hypothetical protein [Nocardia]MCM6772064.1 hypothetical protein [Nocardia pulmonis]MCM6785278.1 hypothetical protein [Nocardia sp. CDC159]